MVKEVMRSLIGTQAVAGCEQWLQVVDCLRNERNCKRQVARARPAHLLVVKTSRFPIQAVHFPQQPVFAEVVRHVHHPAGSLLEQLDGQAP